MRFALLLVTFTGCSSYRLVRRECEEVNYCEVIFYRSNGTWDCTTIKKRVMCVDRDVLGRDS